MMRHMRCSVTITPSSPTEVDVGWSRPTARGPGLRNSDVSRGPPPDWSNTEEEEDLDKEFLGRYYGKRRISFYSRRGGGR